MNKSEHIKPEHTLAALKQLGVDKEKRNMVRTRAGATTRARPPAKRKAPAARRPAKRAKAPATPPPTRLRTATCAACLDAAGPRSVVCGARAHRLCVACAERHINSLPLRGPHGLPGSPDAEAWASRQWAPFCAFCGDGKHRLERFSTKAAEAQLKKHALAHVSERAAKAKAAEAKKATTRSLNALLRLGQPVYRCPRPRCGAYCVHTACDDLRAHHLQLLSTERLVDYAPTFREKVLDERAVNRLEELYALCCSPSLKAELPYLKHPSNIDAHGKPLRGPPVNSNACAACGFLGDEIGEWHRVCPDCKRHGHPTQREAGDGWPTPVCAHCGCQFH